VTRVVLAWPGLVWPEVARFEFSPLGFKGVERRGRCPVASWASGNEISCEFLFYIFFISCFFPLPKLMEW